MSNPKEIDDRVEGTEVANFIDWTAAPQRVGVLASLSKVAKSLRLLPHKGAGNSEWSATDWSEKRNGWIFITSLPAEREALRPLQSVWIDLLVLRLLNEPKEGQKRAWFVIDELASLQRLPQFHTALTENRKSNNPIIMGFQGKAQLEVIYGHLAEVMLSQPATSIFLKTKEPNAGEWVSKAIGKVEIERMRETHFDGTRSGRNFALDRQVEPVVMESEISGLPDLHAFMKYENYVTGFSFPFLDVVADRVPFLPRDLPDDRLTFDPKNLRKSVKPKTAGGSVAPAAPAIRPAIDLETERDNQIKPEATSSSENELATLGATPRDDSPNAASEKETAAREDKQATQRSLNF
jgi:Type IV secretion-system coupling protein DNA-binding domain